MEIVFRKTKQHASAYELIRTHTVFVFIININALNRVHFFAKIIYNF